MSAFTAQSCSLIRFVSIFFENIFIHIESFFQKDPAVLDIQVTFGEQHQRRKRLHRMYEVCKTHTTCEGGKETEEDRDIDDPDEPLNNTEKSGGKGGARTGCSRPQPKLRRRGLALTFQEKVSCFYLW